MCHTDSEVSGLFAVTRRYSPWDTHYFLTFCDGPGVDRFTAGGLISQGPV